MENKRGLSAIVATLIIILLVLVAVGIVWVVVRNLIQEGAGQIEISTKCLAIDLSAVGVVPFAGETGNYSVTLRLNAGETIDGVKIALFNETTNSGVLDGFSDMDVLDTTTEKFATGITSANKLEFTVYFTDTSGNEALCTTNSHTF